MSICLESCLLCVCIPSDWNRNGPLIWHSLNLLILRWHVSTYPETWITHQWALTPDPGWLLSLTNKHVTTNTSVDQTSDELEMVSVYAVRESNDALGLFTDDVEKHVINQRRIAPCPLLFVETCPLQRTGNQGPRRSQRAGRKWIQTVRSQPFQGMSLYWKVFLHLSVSLVLNASLEISYYTYLVYVTVWMGADYYYHSHSQWFNQNSQVFNFVLRNAWHIKLRCLLRKDVQLLKFFTWQMSHRYTLASGFLYALF